MVMPGASDFDISLSDVYHQWLSLGCQIQQIGPEEMIFVITISCHTLMRHCPTKWNTINETSGLQEISCSNDLNVLNRSCIKSKAGKILP